MIENFLMEEKVMNLNILRSCVVKYMSVDEAKVVLEWCKSFIKFAF